MTKVFIGNDHAGVDLKTDIVALLEERGLRVVDEGCHDTNSVDYPDYANRVASKVAADPDAVGILICGTGIGMSIAANKIPGIRAALCHLPFEAEMSRAHNDANVLCMGARVLEPDAAKALVGAFLDTGFDGGRHQRRVGKITALEPTGDPGRYADGG